MFFLTIEGGLGTGWRLPPCVPLCYRRNCLCGPAALSSTPGPAARCLATSDQRAEGRIVGEFCFQLIQRCRRELAGSVQHHNGWFTVALLDAQPAFDVGKQCLGAAWHGQSSRDLGGGAAHGQIPDLALQGGALAFEGAGQLSFAAVVLFGPGLFELLDVARLASSLFGLGARLFFGLAAGFLGGLLLAQELLHLGLQAGDILLLRQTIDAKDELAVLLDVQGCYRFFDAFEAVQLEFQGHCCLPETLSRPCLRVQKSPGSARA